MKQGLILLLAVCTLAAAMVPRERRAMNTEEEEERPKKEETTTTEKECAPQTPCKWVVYNDNVNEELIIVNSYCVCSAGTKCLWTEKDTGVQSQVFRCRVETQTENASEVEDSS